MDDTSLSLLERLQHHPSESAWRDLVELYTPLLDDWLTRFKLQGADREDLVQESLTTVLPHVANFRHHGQGTYNSPHEADMVTAESAHPSAEKLNAFALGRLDGAASADLVRQRAFLVDLPRALPAWSASIITRGDRGLVFSYKGKP